MVLKAQQVNNTSITPRPLEMKSKDTSADHFEPTHWSLLPPCWPWLALRANIALCFWELAFFLGDYFLCGDFFFGGDFFGGDPFLGGDFFLGEDFFFGGDFLGGDFLGGGNGATVGALHRKTLVPFLQWPVQTFPEQLTTKHRAHTGNLRIPLGLCGPCISLRSGERAAALVSWSTAA